LCLTQKPSLHQGTGVSCQPCFSRRALTSFMDLFRVFILTDLLRNVFEIVLKTSQLVSFSYLALNAGLYWMYCGFIVVKIPSLFKMLLISLIIIIVAELLRGFSSYHVDEHYDDGNEYDSCERDAEYLVIEGRAVVAADF